MERLLREPSPALLARASREAWDEHRRRLGALGVVTNELHPESGRALFRRFASDFFEPDRAAELFGQPDLPRDHLDYERWTRPECTEKTRAAGSLVWLRAGHVGARCVRFDRRAGLPVLEMEIASLEDDWAASWAGAFVNFDGARALVVSVDYEAFRCDLRGLRASPYR